MLVVVSYFPLPEDRGDPVRVMSILPALETAFDVTVVVNRRASTTDENVDDLKARLPRSNVVDVAGAPRPRALRLLWCIARGVPPWIQQRHNTSMRIEVRNRLATHDVGLAIGEAAAIYLGGASVPWHWDKANVISASTKRDIDRGGGLAQFGRHYLLHIMARRYERRLAKVAASITVTSNAERIRLMEWTNGPAADVVVSGVPVPAAPQRTTDGGPLKVVWLSSFAYAPNVDGLHRFLAEAGQELRKSNIELTLAGSGPVDSRTRALAADAGATIAGFVDDLEPFLASFDVAIVPVWSGAGIKMKTLTLMAAGLAVVGTDAAFEGVSDEALNDGPIVANSPLDMIDAVRRLSKSEARNRGGVCRRLVQQHFSAAATGHSMVQVLQRELISE